MAAQPRHPYARHIRNELSRDNPGLIGGMLDVIAHSMAIVSVLAASTKRNIMLLNVGNALAMDPNFLAKDRSTRVGVIGKEHAVAITTTGQCIVSKRKDKATARASGILGDILEEIAEEGAEGAFLICAMDDGQVRLQLGNPHHDGHAGPMTHFFHFEDVSFA